jgi:hypothetical protein
VSLRYSDATMKASIYSSWCLHLFFRPFCGNIEPRFLLLTAQFTFGCS